MFISFYPMMGPFSELWFSSFEEWFESIAICIQFIWFFIPMIITWVFLFKSIINFLNLNKINLNPIYTTANIVDLSYSRIEINYRRLVNIKINIEWKTIKIPNTPADNIFRLNVWDVVYIKHEIWDVSNVVLVDEEEYKKNK